MLVCKLILYKMLFILKCPGLQNDAQQYTPYKHDVYVRKIKAKKVAGCAKEEKNNVFKADSSEAGVKSHTEDILEDFMMFSYGEEDKVTSK